MSCVLLLVLCKLRPELYYNDREVERAIKGACVRARVLCKSNLWDSDARIPKSWQREIKRELRQQRKRRQKIARKLGYPAGTEMHMPRRLKKR